MKTKRFIIYLHKILSNHFGILSIKIGKKIPLFGFTPLNGLSVHTISDNVPSIADGGTTEKLTSKYKQNDNKKQIFRK